ncbi:MAG TPA: hypothetical protein VGH73_16750 [Thermoanaerobaculia bacterium]|jgi:hypothetical protein
MRKKLFMLTLAMASVLGALSASVSAPPAAAAGTCAFKVCCPGVPTCYCCSHPCSIQCP